MAALGIKALSRGKPRLKAYGVTLFGAQRERCTVDSIRP